MRLIVSGGGTGGHITPVLAVIGALKARVNEIDLLWVGQALGMEERIVAAAGIDFASIKAGKFRRMHATHVIQKIFNPSTFGLNARDSLRVVSGIYQSLGIIRRFKPDVIFIKGGYVGLPLGIAAGWLRVPFIIHESDLEPGLANRILARRAVRVAVGFPVDKYSGFAPHKLVYTGNPVRPELVSADPAKARRHFGLSAKLPVVLVTGGSQGAREINSAIVAALPQLIQQFQIIHQTGEHEIESVKFQVNRLRLAHPERYHPVAFLTDDMAEALAAADAVIARAGATTIAELALAQKPAILIPNTTMAGHQVANAQLLARAGAARLINEERITPALLMRELSAITGSAEEREYLIKHLQAFGVPDAPERLAEEIIKVTQRGA